MLVSRRVVHDLGLILFKHMGNAAAVPHRTDEHHQIQTGILFPQLLLNVVSVILVDVKNH